MFVFSVKAAKPKLIAVLCVFFAAVVAVTLILNSKKEAVNNDGGISYKAETAQDRVTFLSQFGWKINEDPVEVSEVIIPAEFNDTYEAYNQIQKNQNLNLEDYKGLRVKKWVYEVKNYPNYPADSGCIRATMLVYDNIIIGGDVSSLEPNGFMQGFEFPNENKNEVTSTTSFSQESAQ